MGSKELKHLLKKNHPLIVKKAKKPFRIKYPKLIILTSMIIASYFIFKDPIILSKITGLGELSYIGIFLGGILISFGFSAPFAVGFLIISQPQNLFIATLCGALGATFSDVLIFRLMKFSFLDEFKELEKTKTLHKIKTIIDKNIALKIKHYILYLFAGILIATPLPDEIGVSLLAGLTTIKQKILGVISFILHSITIFFILALSSTI